MRRGGRGGTRGRKRIKRRVEGKGGAKEKVIRERKRGGKNESNNKRQSDEIYE